MTTAATSAPPRNGIPAQRPASTMPVPPPSAPSPSPAASIFDAAMAYHRAGLFVLPTLPGQKRPAVAWKEKYAVPGIRPDEEETAEMHMNALGLCIVCGPLSGHVECIDFDDGGSAYADWSAVIPKTLLDRLVIERSPSGGFHVAYRCPDAVLEGNTKKLARDENGGNLIETRGTGAVFRCTPTPGYQMIQGRFTALNNVTPDERDLMLNTAVALNRYVPKPAPAASIPVSPPVDGLHPYAAKALADECGAVASAVEGSRNDTLNIAAVKLGHYVGGGALPEDLARSELTKAGLASGLEPDGVSATIESGLRKGMAEPKGIPATVKTPGTTSAEKTPAPADLPDFESAAPPWQPFPVHCLPPTLARYVASAAASVNAAPDMVAVPLLAGLASAVGNYAAFHVKGSWEEPSVLWTAVVATSGDGKSPGQAAALRFIREAQKLAIQKNLREKEDAKGSRSAAPRPKVLVTNNTTIEGLASALEDNPRGILLEREEISGVFKAANQYKSGRGCDNEDLIACYDAKTLFTTRKGEGSVAVTRASVSITGGIQPGIARKLLSKNDSEFIENGLAARLLMSLPPKRTPRQDLPPIDEAAMNGVGLLFHRLLSLMPEVLPGDSPPPPRVLRFDAAARERFNEMETRTNAWKEQLDSESPLLKAIPKILGAAVRITGILHLARWVDEARTEDVDPDVIDGRSAEAGVGIASWFFRDARRVYALFGQAAKVKANPSDIAAKIEKYITERGGTVKVRDVQTRFFKRDTVELARTWLAKQYVDSGRARFEKVGKSLRLVMLEPEEPAVEYDEDEDLTPINRMESREAGRLENAAAPGMRRNTLPAMEPYEVEPGVFDFGDCVVDIRELLRNFEKWSATAGRGTLGTS